MFWLALFMAVVLVFLGAVLLRQPGVALYDWAATRRAVRRSVAAAPVPRAHAPAVKHPAAATLNG
ncbi:hypothetical protein KYT87_17585 [Achromobacter sp. ES-001]|uniref:hypothetical protein n=1 Tax=Achromobacter sp. ES-001 TaxID=2860286 RepID=UPI001C6400EE|nr:hypothetical protein [Achromobacter sp. ES-001]QYJ19538.1 hypothetical protein KYT87_17585 [Achromobacter sp. ES-001]